MDTTHPTPKQHAHDRAAATAWARNVLADPRSVVLDLETTGLISPYAVEIAVIDLTGRPLLNRRLQPGRSIEPEAFAVHGIADADLINEHTFADLFDEIDDTLGGRTVLAYNAPYDAEVLRRECRRMYGRDPDGEPYPAADAWMSRTTWACIMRPYAAHRGDWNPARGAYRWPRLRGGTHTALGDARAALAVLQTMATVSDDRCTL
ncbi:3'-5' exonuclease [Streptomyces sp. NPDC090085]|uniref:3'-5' exonuclease n=1 Tax=Streptomyces sp. NPDC090085 TaxID=3365943 RepID=UPI00381A60CF